MSDWHGYPIAKGAHPARPWWNGGPDPYIASIWWFRSDGAPLARMTRAEGERRSVESEHFMRKGETEAAALARIDREHPLPAPPPKVGQVWVTDSDGADAFGAGSARFFDVELAVVGVRRNPVTGVSILWGDGGNTSEWPPPGAVLVAGPGAPWAPA
jgi:hypothetical protein